MERLRRTIAAGLAAGLGLAWGPGGGVMAESKEPPVASEAKAVRPLGVGAAVPDGALVTLSGIPVQFKQLIRAQPSVVIFYRGGWCPYCNVQMDQLVKVEPALRTLGYQVLAITPDQPASLKASLVKHHLTYTLLSDRTMDLTRKFGLAYRVSPEMLAKMKQYGTDLEASTGNALHVLPVPAAYVVDRKGVIHFAYFNADITVRVNPDDLLKAAEAARSARSGA